MKKEILILSIFKNHKNEYQIIRDGGMLRIFEADTMDAQSILSYAIKLGNHVHELEKRPVIVMDRFSESTPCCSKCGGINVETKAWLSFRTGLVETISADEEDNWCNDCEEHVILEDKNIENTVGLEVANIK